MCQSAHGARAIGSDRHKQRGVDPVFLQHSANLPRRRLEGGRQLAGAIKAIVKIGDLANLARPIHLAQAVEREDHVNVLLKSATVEIHRGLGHQQIIARDMAGDHAIAEIAQIKVPVGPPVQTRRGDKGGPATTGAVSKAGSTG